MLLLKKLEKEVMALPKSEYSSFRRWFLDHDFAIWDNKIAQDSESGKLDFLVQEAHDEMKSGD